MMLDSNEGDRFYLTLISKILQTILVGLQDMDFFFQPVLITSACLFLMADNITNSHFYV